MTALPDRVLVYGVTGSGKSTAALALGSRTGLPVTLVDELTWLPGWVVGLDYPGLALPVLRAQA